MADPKSAPAVLTDKPPQEPYHVNGESKRTFPHRRTTADGHTNSNQSRQAFIRDCIEMHKVLKSKVDDPRTEAKDKAACARACDTMLERIRILRGQPLPGQLRPTGEGKKPRGKRAGATTETAVKQPPENVTPLPVADVSHVTLPEDPAKANSAQ